MFIFSKFFKKEDQREIKYYELWALHQSWFKTSKILTMFAWGLCLALMIGIILVARKPPALIVVDDLGKTLFIGDYQTKDQGATEPEIRYFVKTFVSNYIALNSEKIYDQMALAINMMTPSFQQIHLSELKKDNVIEKIKQANIKTNITIKKIALEDTGKSIFVEVLGISEVYLLNSIQSDPKRNGFKAQLRLLRQPRSEQIPNGLLIDDFVNKAVSIVTVEEGKNIQTPSIPEEGSSHE